MFIVSTAKVIIRKSEKETSVFVCGLETTKGNIFMWGQSSKKNR